MKNPRKRGLRLLGVTAGLIGCVVSFPSPADASNDDHKKKLDDVRSATSDFRDIALAEQDGFTLHLKTTSGVACISQPGSGAMGEHLVNPGRVGDGDVVRHRPEVLLYEPRPDGTRRLVGVEYVVFVSDWIKANDEPPSLFGQEFGYTSADNDFGLPPFYSLHAWVWKDNPHGTFNAWNPKVSCP
jgi:hypothetical protein